MSKYAFPIVDGRSGYTTSEGLTKREYFAAMALQGILASDRRDPASYNAGRAVEAADALMTALNIKDQ